MSHFAEINDNNEVIRVIVGNPLLSDEKALEHVINLLGGNWMQTSYNGKIRKNFAGIGFTYSLEFDAFIPPKCHIEATINKNTFNWDCTNSDHDWTKNLEIPN